MRKVVDEEDEESQQAERPRQRQRRDESPDDHEESEGADSDPDSDQDEDHEPNGVERDESEQAALVKKLVRYALACDYSRTAIRRDGIKEKVLGNHGRSFRRVFEGAQKQLRSVFGMEMVELPARDKLTKEEKRKAAKTQGRGQTSTSNAYILVSRLPDKRRSAKIIMPSRIQSADDEAAYVAFYTLMIALITLNGGELSHPKMRRYLNRLNADTNTYNSNKTEDVLQKLIRQGYLVRMTDKDARAYGEEESITWYVGPRGKIEVGPEAIAGMVREVYGGSSDELEARIEASLRVKKRRAIVQNGKAGAEAQQNGVQQNGVQQNGVQQNGASRRRPASEEEEDEDDDDDDDDDDDE